MERKKIKITIPKTIRVFTILRSVVNQVAGFLQEISNAVDNAFKYCEKLDDKLGKLKKELEVLKKLTGKDEVPTTKKETDK